MGGIFSASESGGGRVVASGSGDLPVPATERTFSVTGGEEGAIELTLQLAQQGVQVVAVTPHYAADAYVWAMEPGGERLATLARSGMLGSEHHRVQMRQYPLVKGNQERVAPAHVHTYFQAKHWHNALKENGAHVVAVSPVTELGPKHVWIDTRTRSNS